MKLIEFTLGFLSNLHYLFIVTAVIATAIATLLHIVLFVGDEIASSKRANLVKVSLISGTSALILWFFYCIPTLKDIESVREGLITLDLMSYESLKDGTCEVDTITDHIHCKGVHK